jgi:hypothetical protein
MYPLGLHEPIYIKVVNTMWKMRLINGETNKHKAKFSMEQVYDTLTISLYTSPHNELHLFFLARLTE